MLTYGTAGQMIKNGTVSIDTPIQKYNKKILIAWSKFKPAILIKNKLHEQVTKHHASRLPQMKYFD
jgi:hypothetical protein